MTTNTNQPNDNAPAFDRLCKLANTNPGAAVCCNFLAQVYNGGPQQWVENGYADTDGTDLVTYINATGNDTMVQWVMNVLRCGEPPQGEHEYEEWSEGMEQACDYDVFLAHCDALAEEFLQVLQGEHDPS